MFYAETHTHDRPLYDLLGLKKFAQGYLPEDDSLSDWRDLGTVETDSASVKVEVSCAPAQFFRFTITAKIEDVQPGVLTTGSGTLTDFWPIVEQWANGMLGFNPA